MSIKSVNRSWLAFRVFEFVSFVHGVWFANVNPVGPPTRLRYTCLTEQRDQEQVRVSVLTVSLERLTYDVRASSLTEEVNAVRS